jgi:DNA-binding NarL/FixJ family response regulator
MLSSVRILIADDHELVRAGMRALFQKEPSWIVCGEASTGTQALTMALDLKPDLVVLDLSLPEMNGIEVMRQLRRAMPVGILVLTINDSDEVIREAIEAGANGYVLKADASRTLAEAVHAIVSRGEFVSDRMRRAVKPAPAAGSLRHRRQNPLLLTARERQVLRLLAEGQANKEIAWTLGISTKTAETHRARIMAKLDVHSITDLVRYAIRNRIVEP